MSIAEVGTGILKTHVTWEDVEKALFESTGQVCRFGDNKTIIDIGKGNVVILFVPSNCEISRVCCPR